MEQWYDSVIPVYKLRVRKYFIYRTIMKTNWSLVLAGLLFLVLLSCHKEKDILPEPARLKQVMLYGSLYETEPMRIEEQYEYNILGQISKISYYYYDTGPLEHARYEYNSKGQLIKIKHYNGNDTLSETALYQSNSFTYSSEGKKDKETIEQRGGFVKGYNLFFYSGERLSRIENYSNEGIYGDILIFYTIFEFDDYGQPVREVLYWGSTNIPFKWTINTFSEGLNVKTVIYKDENFEDPENMIREFKRTFDADKKLKILETFQGHASTNVGNFVYKYIYFGE